jgi:hypothetical protein
LRCKDFIIFNIFYFLLRGRAMTSPLPRKHQLLHLKPIVVKKSAIFSQIYPKTIYKVFHKKIFCHAIFKKVFLKINLLYNIIQNNIKISKL